MPIRPRRGEPSAAHLTRRGWLVGSLVAGWGLVAARADIGTREKSSTSRRSPGRPACRPSGRAGRSTISGSATPRTATASRRCGSPGRWRPPSRSIFGARVSTSRLPEHRLTVVTLAGPDSYAAFLGEDPGQVVGGHYDLDTNRLVIFDFRPDAANLAADPERVNTLTLIHEATHQLTFNTGLLNRLGDVPLCLSEGLAMYGEVWRPGRPSAPGGDQHGRGSRRSPQARDPAAAWIPAGSTALRRRAAPRRGDAASRPTRRAGSWSTPCSPIAPSLPGFRAYLDALRGRRDPEASARRRHDPPRESRPPRPHVAASRQAPDPRVIRGRGLDHEPEPIGDRHQPRTGFSPMFLRISARCFS